MTAPVFHCNFFANRKKQDVSRLALLGNPSRSFLCSVIIRLFREFDFFCAFRSELNAGNYVAPLRRCVFANLNCEKTRRPRCPIGCASIVRKLIGYASGFGLTEIVAAVITLWREILKQSTVFQELCWQNPASVVLVIARTRICRFVNRMCKG